MMDVYKFRSPLCFSFICDIPAFDMQLVACHLMKIDGVYLSVQVSAGHIQAVTSVLHSSG